MTLRPFQSSEKDHVSSWQILLQKSAISAGWVLNLLWLLAAPPERRL
jgi:hypothetical protein